jgi:hypothetical protein
VKPEEMRAAKDLLNFESLQDSEKGREVFRRHGLALDRHRSQGKQGKGLEDSQIALSGLFNSFNLFQTVKPYEERKA